MKKKFLFYLFFSIFVHSNNFPSTAFDYSVHPGGKAIRSDLIAIFSQVKDLLLDQEFQKDLGELVEKYASKVLLKQEQYKDLIEMLEILQSISNLDWPKLKDEQRIRAEQETKISNRVKKQIQKEERKSNKKVEENVFWNKFFELASELKEGQETIKYDTLANQLEEKIPDYYSFREAYEQIFNVDYDDRYSFNQIILTLLKPAFSSVNKALSKKTEKK